MYLGDNLLAARHHAAGRGVPRASSCNSEILLTKRAQSAAVRRRRARRTGASCGWPRSRRSRSPTWRWSASTCSTRTSSKPREADQAVEARRAGDHRRHPVADRPRLQRPSRTSSRAGGRTPASSRTCWRPTAPSSTRSSTTSRGNGRSASSRIEGKVVDRGRGADRRLRRARPGHHRRRRPHRARLRRPVHLDRQRLRASSTARSRTRSCWRARAITHVDGRIEASLIGKNVKIGKTDRKPAAYRFMLGDNSEVGIT